MLRKWLLVMMVLSIIVVPGLTSQAQDPLKIGVLTDHSGALAFYGFEQTQGFQLGLEYATDGTMEVAGRPIEVVERDNAGDVETGVADARALIEEEGVEVLFGSVSSTVTLSLVASAAEYETVLFAGPAAAPQVTGENFNEFVFRACRNSFQDAFTVARYALETYGTNYVQLAPDSAFGTGSAAAFDFVAQSLGATAARETILVAADTTDFTPAIEEVLAAGADFVYVTWAGASGVTLFTQLGELGVKDEMAVLTGFNSNSIQSQIPINQAGDVGLIVYHYTLPDTEINTWFVEKHMEEFGTPPDLFSECGFATAVALVSALEATEGSTLAEDLIPALEGLSFEGPKGSYTIRAEDHQAVMPMYMVELTEAAPEEGTFAYYTLLAEISAEDAAPPCLAPAARSSEALPCLGQ